MMVRAPPTIQFKLMQHMLLDPAGKYMLRTYAGMLTGFHNILVSSVHKCLDLDLEQDNLSTC